MGFRGDSAVKNLPAMQELQELQVQFPSQEDPLEEGMTTPPVFLGFPGGSVGKESVCNTGNLGWEDPLEEDMATHSSILAWRIPMERGTWWAPVHGVAKRHN